MKNRERFVLNSISKDWIISKEIEIIIQIFFLIYIKRFYFCEFEYHTLHFVLDVDFMNKNCLKT